MICLGACQPEETFLQDRIVAVPQCNGKAEILMAVTDAGNSVLVPAICAGTGMIVGEVVPGFAG